MQNHHNTYKQSQKEILKKYYNVNMDQVKTKPMLMVEQNINLPMSPLSYASMH